MPPLIFACRVSLTSLLQSPSKFTKENQWKYLPFCEDNFPFLSIDTNIRCNFYQFMSVVLPKYINSCTFISFCYLVKYYHPYFTEEWLVKKLHDLLITKNCFQHSHISTLHHGAWQTHTAFFLISNNVYRVDFFLPNIQLIYHSIICC